MIGVFSLSAVAETHLSTLLPDVQAVSVIASRDDLDLPCFALEKDRIFTFLWLDEILDKLLRKHQVHEHEVVEVFEGSPEFRFVEKGHREGEHVYSAMGRSDAGRYLVVFFIHKTDGRALPVSARNMAPAERKRYGRK